MSETVKKGRETVEIKIFKKLRLESKSLKNISVKENDILLKKIALRASKEVLQPSTYNNMLFAYQIEELIKQTMPEVIITTYEGHAFERIAFAAARSVKPDILCIGETKIDCDAYKDIDNSDTFSYFKYRFWSHCSTKKGYSGTAILSRKKPLNVI
jgi:hypothetical protein